MYVLLVIYLFTDGEFRTLYESHKTMAACEARMLYIPSYAEKQSDILMYGATCTTLKGRET